MAVINKQFIHFAKKATLENHLKNNEILPTSIVFVKETGEIYVNGKYYTNYNQTEANTTAIETIKELSGWWIEPEIRKTIAKYLDGSVVEYDIKGELSRGLVETTDLVELSIGDEVTIVGNVACVGTLRLITLNIPSSVETIENGAFANCSGLTTLNIENGLKYIISPFVNCSFSKLVLPNSVLTIDGGGAFANNNNLTEVVLSNNITLINDGAFLQCNNLSSVTYKGIEYTSKSALENVLTENGVTLGRNVFNDTALTD